MYAKTFTKNKSKQQQQKANADHMIWQALLRLYWFIDFQLQFVSIDLDCDFDYD